MTDHLSWTGDEPPTRFIPGVPARDLEPYDLERIVYRRTVGQRGDRSGGHAPADPEFAEARDGIVTDLIASGLYAKGARKAAPEPTAPADPAPAQE